MSDKQVSFSGFNIKPTDIADIKFEGTGHKSMSAWARLVLPMPKQKNMFDTRNDPVDLISKWIENNCQGMFFISKFWLPGNNYEHQYFLTLRFENTQDAVLFKLQDLEQIVSNAE